MRFHTDPTDTITVEENVHPLYGVRSVRARINDDTGTSLDLYQSGDYVSESVRLHLNQDNRRRLGALNVEVETYEGHSRDRAPWATLTLSGAYKSDTGLRGHRESKVYLSAENLVEIRDELSRAIRRARKDGHIS
jgi:hypothetical protein|tara:strand:- start:1365 stop:1769 length:405 start_codon:yes stop_codon:yes gene_type:complete